MRKLLLFFFALLAGVSGVWGTDSWNSGYTTPGDKVNVKWVGFHVPEDVSTGSYYMNLELYMYETSGINKANSTYLGVFTSTEPSAETLVGFSANKPESVTTAGYVTYMFTSPLPLTSNTTYYLFFFDDVSSYAYSNNRIGLCNGLYTYGMKWNNDKEHTDWAPIFRATIATEGLPVKISKDLGNFSNLTSNGNWANAWTSSATQNVKLSTANQYISTQNDAIYSGGSSSTYTIAVNEGFQIIGYSLKGRAISADKDQTVTPVDDSENPKTFTSSADNSVTISGITKTSTTFSLSGANTGLVFSDFVVFLRINPSISTMVSTLKTNMETYKDLTGVGYPKSDAAERTALSSAYTIIDGYNGSTMDGTKAVNYANQLNAYTDYLRCTDIDMPEDGKTYKVQNVRYDGGSPYYLYNNSNHIAASSSLTETNQFYFVAHKLPGQWRSKGSSEKYFFVSKETNLHLVCADKENNEMTDGYEPAYINSGVIYDLSAIGLEASSKTEDASDNEKKFGALNLWGVRKNSPSFDGVIIIQSADGGLNNYHTTQLFNATYSTLYRFIEVASAEESYYNTVTLNSIGGHSYATTYLPFAVKMPEGVKAYKATGDGDSKLTLVKVADGDAATDAEKVLPALTAAVLYKDAGTATETKTLEIVESDASAPGDNILDGSLKAAGSAPSGTCVLWGSGSEVGFYPLSDSALPTCKAYYAPASPVKGFTLSFEEVADGIRAAQGEEMQQQGIYNLSGQRIQKPTKGLYIVNGKKVVIK